jgi:hypothetical protein
MKPVKLCQHIKDNGSFCGSPALRKRRYCYFHDELQRRRRRIARCQLIASTAGEFDLEGKELMSNVVARSPEIKNLILNSFNPKTLRDTFGLNPDGSRFCNREGGGGD